MLTLRISGSLKQLDEAIVALAPTTIHHIVRFKNEYLVIYTP